MKAGLRSILFSEGDPASVYHLDVVVDDGPAPDETGFTPWDRATYTSGFETFTEVTLDALPEIPYGGLDVDAGDLVLPSYTQIPYSDDEASTARAWFDAHAVDLARGRVYVRYYSVETDRRSLDWFGRVTARGLRKPVNPATRAMGFRVDASCGLSDLQGLPAEPTTDVPLGSIIARALCRANPHNTLRIYLDVSASNQYVDGSSRTSALHLRSTTEWAGPAYVAEGSADTPADADGDYGNIDAILDTIAQSAGLRVYLSPSTGDWHAVPATMLGEAITKAEKVVCAAAVDGGATWSFEGVSADTWTPADASELDDADDHGWDVAPRLSAVTLDTGGASLVRQPFPSAPVPSLAEADTPPDAVAVQQLVAVAAEADRRLTLLADYQGYEVPPSSGLFEYPGGLQLSLVGFSGTTYWVDAAGAWQTSTQTLGASLSTSSVSVTTTADFPEAGRLYITLVGDDTTGVTVSGDLEYADLTSISIQLKDSSGGGAPATWPLITSWRIVVGESDLPGDVEAYESAPPFEADEDGADDWQAVTGWQSARWSTTQSVLAEYGAEAELRRRAKPLDSFDGVALDLLGPEVRLLLPSVTDMEDAGDDASAKYIMGAGATLRPSDGTTRGLWFRLPTEAQ